MQFIAQYMEYRYGNYAVPIALSVNGEALKKTGPTDPPYYAVTE